MLAMLSEMASSQRRWRVSPVPAIPMASNVTSCSFRGCPGSAGLQGCADGGELRARSLRGELEPQHGVDVRDRFGVEVDVVAVEARWLERARGCRVGVPVVIRYGGGERILEGDALSRVARRVDVGDVVRNGALTRGEAVEGAREGGTGHGFEHSCTPGSWGGPSVASR